MSNVIRHFHELPTTCTLPQRILIEVFGVLLELRSRAKEALREGYYKVSAGHFIELRKFSESPHLHSRFVPEVESLFAMNAKPSGL